MAPPSSDDKRSIEHLALYHYDSCGYCARVRRHAQGLGINLELRDVRYDDSHYEDLVNTMGRGTVPVLRIRYADGEEEWLPESRHIVAFLDAHFRI